MLNQSTLVLASDHVLLKDGNVFILGRVFHVQEFEKRSINKHKLINVVDEILQDRWINNRKNIKSWQLTRPFSFRFMPRYILSVNQLQSINIHVLNKCQQPVVTTIYVSEWWSSVALRSRLFNLFCASFQWHFF